MVLAAGLEKVKRNITTGKKLDDGPGLVGTNQTLKIIITCVCYLYRVVL